ncbi:MAG TPA: hypothetical protein VNB22_08045, partial [Pyrinomonadaceae bacterium]|nr:hypothetical protein [Pyrinomonadaceae bacterium]
SYNFSYYSIQTGNPGDIIQPGDYDGDYVADIGFYRPSTQSWKITFRGFETNFGGSNVIPTASMLKIE